MVKSVSKMVLAMLALGCAVQAAVSETARSAMEAARRYGAAVRSCDMNWAVDSMYPPLKLFYAEQYSNRNGQEAENAKRTMGINEVRETSAQASARISANMKALRAYYIKLGEQMKARGVKIESYTVQPPVAEYVVVPARGVVRAAIRDKDAQVRADQLQGEAERCRLVVLPITIIVSVPNPQTGAPTRVERTGHIYAIRDEQIIGADSRGMTRRGTKINQWYFADSSTEVSVLRTLFPNLPLHLRLPSSGERVLR